ncbi:hypothetical protein HDK77DRAFT_169335 [Phyllosticta capitalensis]|uniref:Cupin type-2 domain-containing protein n=1 Tax=Phyllosticta capitalensis TaxID=121624 RepID=A0ABR1YS22_9PEZI
MVRAGAVKVVRAESLRENTAQTEGITRWNAIQDMSDQVCGTVTVAKPHTSSAVHHHGAEDTIIYAVRGHGSILSDNGKTRQELAPGDFALIPAFSQHQEVNDSDEEVVWVVARGGRNPIVVNLDNWGQELRRKSKSGRNGSEGSLEVDGVVGDKKL